VSTHWDVTEDLERVVALEEREREMKRQNLRFDAAVNNMAQGLCMFDTERRLVICNAPFAKLYGLPDKLTVAGTLLDDILNYRRSSALVGASDTQTYLAPPAGLHGDRGVLRAEYALPDGRIVAITCHPMRDGGWVATHEDVTVQHEQQDRIRHLARHDPLTDLPNRTHFSEDLTAVVERIGRGEKWAMLYLDLDHFKPVNDTLGHAIGDAVLREVATRIRIVQRKDDLVARLGGDEFALLAGPLAGPDEAAAIARRVVEAVNRPFRIDGHEISIAASIGIAIAPQDGTDATTIMRHADLALYRAKSEGRANFQFFESEMNATLQERRFLETGIRAAVTLNQLRLVYQPILRTEDNSISCFEALLRWDHPERGTIPPIKFIPIAEETGAMIPIGNWVLREACRTAATWPSDVRIAVNLSAVQFKARDLVAQVEAALADNGLPGDRLDLEITESLLLADTDATLATLHQLHNLGVRISMDDFGTGYSSLSYLRAFPFDKIKIDRSFVSDLSTRSDSQAIVEAVVGLGRSLGMQTIAEGVETEQELEIIRKHGCEEVQGYLFSPPVTSTGASELIAKFGTHTKTAPPSRARNRARQRAKAV